MKAIAIIATGLALTSCTAVKGMNANDWSTLLGFGAHVIQEARQLGLGKEDVKTAVDAAAEAHVEAVPTVVVAPTGK